MWWRVAWDWVLLVASGCIGVVGGGIEGGVWHGGGGDAGEGEGGCGGASTGMGQCEPAVVQQSSQTLSLPQVHQGDVGIVKQLSESTLEVTEADTLPLYIHSLPLDSPKCL